MHWCPIVAAASVDWVKTTTDLLGIVAATFVGAFMAFRFETRHRAKQVADTQISAGQRALFALVAQVSALENLNTQHLAPLRDDLARDLKLLVVGVGHQVPTCDVDSLMYLVQDEPQILAQLLDGQQTFDSLFSALEQRNRYHIEFQERLAVAERSRQQPHAELSREQIRNAVGPNIVRALSDLTQQVFDSYESARAKVHTNFATLREGLKRRFPRSKFLKFELMAGAVPPELQQSSDSEETNDT